MTRFKEHDVVRHIPTGEVGTILLTRDDGSCVIELSSPFRVIDTYVDKLEKTNAND